MKITPIARSVFQNLFLLFCSVLLITTLYLKENSAAAENISSNKQISNKATIKEDDKLPQNVPSSYVVVEVNGIKLTQGELDEKIRGILESVKGQVPLDRMEEVSSYIRNKFIEEFITNTLLSQEIEKQNIVISDNELKLAISEIEAKLPQGMTMETALTQSGITLEKLREEVYFNLQVNKLLEAQMKGDFTPSQEEVQQYYINNKEKFITPEKVHARHILIRVDAKDNEKTKGEKMARIMAIRTQLLKGADFEKLARENSECPSGEKGGELDTFTRGTMVRPFEDAAFSQKLNEIGPVVETQFGYHLIQVLEHSNAIQKSLHEVKADISKQLKRQKEKETVQHYIDALRKRAKIVYGAIDGSKK